MSKPDTATRDTATVSACWSCRGPVPTAALFCGVCGAVQPPRAVDAFDRLGLPARFSLDPAGLDRAYFALQRQLHPDRFAARTPRERAIAQAQASALNTAYEALRDPLRRARHLAERRGIAVQDPDQHTIDDPALLMAVMETREALAGADGPEAVAAIAREAAADRAACEAALAEAFDRAGGREEGGREEGGPARGDAAGVPDAARVRDLVLRLAYLVKLGEEVRMAEARQRRHAAARQAAALAGPAEDRPGRASEGDR